MTLSLSLTLTQQKLTSRHKNWDREDAEAFLDELDRDGSGTIQKDEFIDYGVCSFAIGFGVQGLWLSLEG